MLLFCCSLLAIILLLEVDAYNFTAGKSGLATIAITSGLLCENQSTFFKGITRIVLFNS